VRKNAFSFPSSILSYEVSTRSIDDAFMAEGLSPLTRKSQNLCEELFISLSSVLVLDIVAVDF